MKRVIEAIIACLAVAIRPRDEIAEALMSELKLRRLSMLMEPEPGNPQEIEGVLNPAAASGPDGELYLFRGSLLGGMLAHRHYESTIR